MASALLENDSEFQMRNRACVIEQSETFKDDGRADMAACARACLKLEPELFASFLSQAANGPGMGAKVDLGNGKIDQSKVTDEDLLSLTQANFPSVASLFFDSTGAPIS